MMVTRTLQRRTGVRWLGLALFGLLLSLLLSNSAAAQTPPEKSRVLVALRQAPAGNRMVAAQEQKRAQEALLEALPAEEVRPLHQFAALPGLAAEVTPAGLEALRHRPEVAAVAIDLPVQAALSPSASFINADQVQQRYGLTGMGVNVAILDSGIDLDHPDLAARIVAQQCFNKNETCPPNDTTQGDSGQDEHGHGTHVAGTIASQGLSGSPAGLAPDVGLVAVRVLDGQGSGYTSDVLAGIDWIVANQATLDVKAINLSLGGWQLRRRV